MKQNRIILILLFIVLSFNNLEAPEHKMIYIIETPAIHYISPERLLQKLRENGIKYHLIVWRQAMLESNYIKSRLAIEGRNLFGMKHNNRGYSIGEIYGHANYPYYNDCIKDYKTWQDLYYKRGDYYEFLVRIGYAEDENYTNKLKKIKL